MPEIPEVKSKLIITSKAALVLALIEEEIPITINSGTLIICDLSAVLRHAEDAQAIKIIHLSNEIKNVTAFNDRLEKKGFKISNVQAKNIGNCTFLTTTTASKL